MTSPWYPSVRLPTSWKRVATVSHPSQLCESTNLCATKLPAFEYTPSGCPKCLSNAQAEAVYTCCGSFEHGNGAFWLGDATGVGKGRTIAGICSERLHRGTCVWITSGRSLYADCERDISAVVEQHVQVLAEPSVYQVGHEGQTIILLTYRKLHDPRIIDEIQSILRPYGSSGTLILDEVHVARNLQTTTGQSLQLLLDKLPQTKVVYSTATAANDLTSMSYMNRLGLWGDALPYGSAQDFIQTLKPHGEGALELIAIDLKRRGVYIARTLFMDPEMISLFHITLTQADLQLYRQCCEFWSRYGAGCKTRRMPFFRLLLTSLKTAKVTERARKLLHDGFSVIITVQHTGRAHCMHTGSNLGIVLQTIAASETGERRFQALQDAHSIAESLPGNPVDILATGLQEFGVAELTGRVGNDAMRSHAELFQQDHRHVAIMSSAAAHGLSLHMNGHNRRPRVHILLELPWSAEQFVQQCGRSCRTGQHMAPRYEIAVTNAPAELRFSGVLVDRLHHMGALTRGDADTPYTGLAELDEHSGIGGGSKLLFKMQSVLMGRSIANAAIERFGPLWMSTTRFERDNLRQVWDALLYLGVSSLQISRIMQHFGAMGIASLLLARTGRTWHDCELNTLRVAAAACCKKRSLQQMLIPSPWTLQNHRCYAHETQRAVEVVLMCGNRPRTVFHNLPRDLLLILCQHIADAHTMEWGSDAEATVGFNTLLRADFGLMLENRDPKRFLNELLAIPVDAQQCIGKVMGQVAHATPRKKKRSGVMSLEEYVLNTRKADMELITTVDRTPSQNPLFDITIKLAARHVKHSDIVHNTQRHDAVVGHGVNARNGLRVPFVITRASETSVAQLWLPGRAAPSRTGKRVNSILELSTSSVFIPRECTVDAWNPGAEWTSLWNEQTDEHHVVRAEIASRLCGSIRGATTHALQRIAENDTAVILRCERPSVDTPFTCLVVDANWSW